MAHAALLRSLLTALSSTLLACSGGVSSEPATAGGVGAAGSTGSGADGGAGAEGGGGGDGCVDRAWGRVLGGDGSQYTRDVAVDASGAVVASVQFVGGQVTLEGEPLTQGTEGFLLVKLDAEGRLVFAREFGSSTQSELLPVGIDASEHVVVGGSFYGSVDLGNGVSATAPAGAELVAKFGGEEGNAFWARAFPDGFAGAGVSDLVLDADGNIFITGALSGHEIDFGSGPLVGDVFLAKLGPTGGPLWAKTFSGVLLESRSLAVAPSGAIVFASSLYAPADLGGGPLPHGGGFDVLVASFDTNGEHLFSRSFGNHELQRSSAVTVDELGAIRVVGTFFGSFELAGSLESPGEYSAFVAVLVPSGDPLLSRALPGDGWLSAIGMFPNGDMAIGGSFYGTFDSGCGLVDSGEQVAFVSRLDPTGNCVSTRSFGPGSGQILQGLVVDDTGTAVCSGQFSGSIDFGEGPVESDGNDGFVASLGTDCD